MALPILTTPTYNLTVPSTGEIVKFRPFLVGEEKILLIAMESEDEAQIFMAMSNIIEACTFEKLAITDLAIFDIEYIFLQLRSKSKGEMIDLNYKCPECEHLNPLQVNVDKITITKNDKHTDTIELAPGIGIKMKYPKLEYAMKMKGENNIKDIFNIIKSCINYVYDSDTVTKPEDITAEELDTFLDSLTDKHFNDIQNYFKTMPTLQAKLKYKCSECNYNKPIEVEGITNFLA